ncbi:endopeptidase La [Taurinivorans muris]|uniref:Lon protease n=1 Tax=Taurinivorans muris TaxID=2787751 RepID=A0ABY5Y1Z0_9BACT|nr:endopeptidase La [Desulfovibrionaceae bacterium LT0009]
MVKKKDDENFEIEDKPKKRGRPKKSAAKETKIVDSVPTEQEEIFINEQALLNEVPHEIGLLSLRENVLFNSMIMPIYETRESGIAVIEKAYNSSKFIFITAQKDSFVDEPKINDLYAIGTVGLILRMVKLPNGHIKALIQGISRAKCLGEIAKAEYPQVFIELIKEKTADINPEVTARIRLAREYSEKILQLRGVPIAEIMAILMQVDEPGKLADLIASNMRIKADEAQVMLECLDPVERLNIVIKHLLKEVEIADLQAKIQNIAREGMDKAQKTYYLREQIKAIRSELGENANMDEELDTLRENLEKIGLSKEAKAEAKKQLYRLSNMGVDSAEANVVRTYLDWLVELPWKKTTKDILDIAKAKKLLDADHYGLTKIKDRILEFLSVRKLNPQSKATILCFVGPPGVGKTSLGRSIAKAMNRKFQRISLGGMRDEAEIRGHRRTYVGAMPGRIIQAMKNAGTKNPVIVLDEIDKLGNDFRGDPSSALLEALDPEQNSHFSDHYLNVEFDLSKVLFLCTANNIDSIPHALRDRMEIIRISGYTELEKLAIVKSYILKRQILDNGLTEKQIKITDNSIKKVIREYTREAGLRNLEREIGAICRKVARKVAEHEITYCSVTPKMIEELLGAPRFLEEEREKKLLPGVATGLAWTQSGGDVLFVEVSKMKGKGAVQITGQLGDVMKESCQAAVSYIRSHADILKVEEDFYEKYDLHIHVPEGATPKDGPSAGVTLFAAILSSLLDVSAKSEYCMTGEITLRGRVLPVGGIKEKILAAVTRGLKDVIIPKQNMKDLEDIPAELLEKITVHPVTHVDDVRKLIF